MKLAQSDGGSNLDYFSADVSSVNDYYPFGMIQPRRSFSLSSYRYGFNGMEKDDEVSGNGNNYTTHFRAYDTRIGRWFSENPVVFPWKSPYVATDQWGHTVLFGGVNHVDYDE